MVNALQIRSSGKNLSANAGDERVADLVPGLGRSPERENGNPLQYSCLENPTDRGTWQATVCGVAESETQLSTNLAITLQVLLLILPELVGKEARIWSTDVCVCMRGSGWGVFRVPTFNYYCIVFFRRIWNNPSIITQVNEWISLYQYLSFECHSRPLDKRAISVPDL